MVLTSLTSSSLLVLTRLLQEEQPPEEEAEVRVLHAQRPLQGQERGGGLRGGGG